jgi:hypothetical protein
VAAHCASWQISPDFSLSRVLSEKSRHPKFGVFQQYQPKADAIRDAEKLILLWQDGREAKNFCDASAAGLPIKIDRSQLRSWPSNSEQLNSILYRGSGKAEILEEVE